MVNVGLKEITRRICRARGEVQMSRETLARIVSGDVPKGDVFAVARLAGIQAAKRTADWIPLAHPLPLDAIEVILQGDPERGLVEVEATAEAHSRTGVEMEALVAVAAASLTVYDMCKGVDRGMKIGEVLLVSKSGGKSGEWTRPGEKGRELATAMSLEPEPKS